MIHDTQSAQISQKQDEHNIYVIMKTMCPPGYHHNIYIYPKITKVIPLNQCQINLKICFQEFNAALDKFSVHNII